MRTPIRRVATLVAAIVLAACSSGTTIVVHRPAPPPPPPRPRVEPLEITVARPVRGQLVVQTNRASYVALFEIVPDRGVALLAPSYAHQRTWMLAGINWVPVSWKLQSSMYYGRPSGTSVPARWIYAIASDEPLRLPDEAFHPSYLRRVLGPAAYRGTNPYLTMRAISRAFVPSVIDESWAEDAYALAATHASDPYRTVRIYCANRTVYEVPEEVADRAWCPAKTPSGTTIVISVPARPDSVVASNGQRLRRRYPETTPVRAPIDRVSEPTRPENAPLANDKTPPRNDTNADVKDAKEKERRNNGNAYGHTDDPNVKGRGIENEKKDHGKPSKDEKVKIENGPPADSRAHDPRREPRMEVPAGPPHVQPEYTPVDKGEAKQEKQEEKQLRREEKQEQKVENKAEHKPEHKVDHKPDHQVEQQPEQVTTPKDEPPAAKPDVKHEPKVEAQPEPKEEKAEAKQEKQEEKQEEKAAGKPDDKPQAKPVMRPPGMKDHKGKP